MSMPLARTFVVMSTLDLPSLKSSISLSLSAGCKSPCKIETACPSFFILVYSFEAVSLVWTKIIDDAMVSSPYSSQSTSNLCCSESQSMYNCLMASTFSSSCLSSKELACGTKVSEYFRTSSGNVAENRTS
ncbi:hypothetical protein OGAPHI_004693 [Ogataea philodendri]|uniref:Uncharacterized protein n=1 Tax=Ogataea philodendri TaxID=1378263 RepID=A0A9P8T3A2_9ASCO|nr:uncharacterized protein OGAPHI_004693 [Ogataea philodendri]KAH3663979.1 hypothetical protein OGAPHI_004693 [Ogataea philodendri]